MPANVLDLTLTLQCQDTVCHCFHSLRHPNFVFFHIEEKHVYGEQMTENKDNKDSPASRWILQQSNLKKHMWM